MTAVFVSFADEAGPGAAKWLLLVATVFLLAGAIVQAIIELARYVDLADSLGVSLTGHLTGWARDQYHAVGSDVRKVLGPESVGEYVSATFRLWKKSLLLVFWPWVTPVIVYSLGRDAIRSWATDESGGIPEQQDQRPPAGAGATERLTQLKAASARATGWTLVVVGAGLALTSAVVDIVAT